MYIRYPAQSSGVLSINGDTTSAQLVVGGTNISVATVAGTTTISSTLASAITSINADTTAAQVIAAGTGMSVATVAGTTTITNTAPALSVIHEVWVNTPAGHGSAAGNVVRCYSNIKRNTGTSITYASDAVSGDTFTINVTGIYAITRFDRDEGALGYIFGLSVNSASLTANVYDLADAQQLGFTETAATGVWVGGTLPFVGKLTAGDVVRGQDVNHTHPDTTQINGFMHIVRLS